MNETAAALTGGRVRRVFLHSPEGHPHTGCGCFAFIALRLRDGSGKTAVAVMERGYGGRAPDGRG